MVRSVRAAIGGRSDSSRTALVSEELLLQKNFGLRRPLASEDLDASLPCAVPLGAACLVVVFTRQRRKSMTAESPAAALAPNAKFIAVCCGVGAAACWAVGLVAARHGIAAGLAPADLAFHRFMWSGLLMLPLAWRWGLGDAGGIGWGIGILLMILGGPGLTILSHSGFILAPLGHGAVIQPRPRRSPACCSRPMLRETISRARVSARSRSLPAWS